MEVVGAISGVITIAVEFDHVYKRLRRCYRCLKYARSDIKAICDEVESFSSILSLFHCTMTDERLMDEGLSLQIKASNLVPRMVTSGRDALDKIDDILIGVDPLRLDMTYSTLEQWYARWKWSTRKEEWYPVQKSLTLTMASANLLISIVNCQNQLRILEQLRAQGQTVPIGVLEKFSLYVSRTNTMMSRCKKAERECRRMQAQQAEGLQMAQEIVAVARHLAKSHIASHPTLDRVLGHRGHASIIHSNSTTSRNSDSPGSPTTRRPTPGSPRDPGSGPSSAHTPLHETPSDATDHAPLNEISSALPVHPVHPPAAENPMPAPHVLGSRTPPEQTASSRRSSPGPESGTSGTPSPHSSPADNSHSWVPTALFGPPQPSIRPANPRQSDTDVSERPVIIDDGKGIIREEHRRPRRSARSRHGG